MAPASSTTPAAAFLVTLRRVSSPALRFCHRNPRDPGGSGCEFVGCARGRFGAIFARGRFRSFRFVDFTQGKRSARPAVVSRAEFGGRFQRDVPLGIRSSIRCGGDLESQANQRFLRFFLPLRAAEALSGGGVPLRGLLGAPDLFFDGAELPRNHGVARALIKLGKLRERVGAGFGLADTSLNLAPVCHGRALYQRYVKEANQGKAFWGRPATAVGVDSTRVRIGSG